MSDFEISNHMLQKECEQLAREIFDEVTADMAEDETPEDYRDTMSDRAHETADGHEWVIYNYKALMLCAMSDTTLGEEFLDDIGFEWTSDSTIYTVATTIAYGEMRGRIEQEIHGLIEAWEEEHEAA